MLIFYYSFTKQMTPHIPWVMICLGKKESQEKCPRKCLSGLISFIVKGSRLSLQKSGTLRVSWNSTFSLKINDHDGTIFFIYLFSCFILKFVLSSAVLPAISSPLADVCHQHTCLYFLLTSSEYKCCSERNFLIFFLYLLFQKVIFF